MKALHKVAWLLSLGPVACGPSSAPVSTSAPSSASIERGVTSSGSPAPAALDETARRFGFVALGGGWTWEKLDVETTRFDWSGRPASRDREVLVSFWLPTIDATEQKFLPSLVQSAAANLTERNDPCDPVDQPKEIVDTLRVERVITVCFEPSQNYGKGFTTGVLHGIIARGTLTVVAIFSNRRAGLIPSPDEIGLRAR